MMYVFDDSSVTTIDSNMFEHTGVTTIDSNMSEHTGLTINDTYQLKQKCHVQW